MLEELLGYYQQFMEISKANPVVASVLSVGVGGALLMALKQLPGKILKLIGNQCRTTLTMTNAGWDGGREQFKSFMRWYIRHSWSNFSRSLSLETQYQYRGEPLVNLGAGFGTHFFWYKHRLFWFEKIGLDSSGSDLEKYQIQISGLTRNRKLFEDLIEEFRYRTDENTISVSSWTGEGWGEPQAITKRALNTVVMNEAIRTEIMRDIERFIHGREWYEQRGLPYKLTMLLHGKPGTGKTSLIKALASHYNRNVYCLNLSTLSDTGLIRAMASVPTGSIILIEDFDTNSTVKRRSSMTPAPAVPAPVPKDSVHDVGQVTATLQPIESKEEDIFSMLTLSGLLNALDGIVPLDGTMIFMTTNHLENIDPALIRNGRVDKRIEIPYLTHDEVERYIGLMFPEFEYPDNKRYFDIAGCDLMALFSEHRDDAKAFRDAIPGKLTKQAGISGMHAIPCDTLVG